MARYHSSNKAKVVFAPAVSSIAAPSRAEITAGTVLTVAGSTAYAGLIEDSGWETVASDITVPDVGTDFDGTIPGRQAASSASMKFYADDASTTVRTALAEGTAGYMIRMPEGDVPTDRCEVWPVRVSALNDSAITSANEAKTFMVTFAVTSEPNKNAVIPAA